MLAHTAIIQSNQQRIADKLGEFIEVHFLEAGPVEAKLRQVDFGSFVADGCDGPTRTERHVFDGDRSAVREAALRVALGLLAAAARN